MHAHMTYKDTHIHTQIYIYMYIYIYIYMYMQTHILQRFAMCCNVFLFKKKFIKKKNIIHTYAALEGMHVHMTCIRHTHIHAYTYIYIYVYIYMFIQTHVLQRVAVCCNFCLSKKTCYKYIRSALSNARAHDSQRHTHTHTYMYMYIYVYVYIYINTCIPMCCNVLQCLSLKKTFYNYICSARSNARAHDSHRHTRASYAPTLLARYDALE